MHRKSFAVIIISLIILPVLLFSQEQKSHPKGSYVDSLNRYYHQTSLPLYIRVSTTPDGPATQLPIDNTKNPDKMEPIYLDGNGKHLLHHVNTRDKLVENFAIFADGISPKTIINFLDATHYVSDDEHYYGPGLKLKLTSSDDLSGVKNIYHSMNEAEYSEYSSAFSPEDEGEYVYKFYSVDNVGNIEKVQSYNFNYDATPPQSAYQIVSLISGNVISVNTTITLSAEDEISGVAKIYYSIDDDNYKIYQNKAIAVKDLTEGEHTLKYYSVDNVENEEEPNTYTFFLDKSSPIVASDILGDRFIVSNQMYFSGRTKFKITAVDNKSGVKEVLYSVDGGDFTKYDEPFYLPGKSGLHTILYYAIDNMNNEGVGNPGQKYDKYDHKSSVIYIDLDGPTLKQQFLGPKFIKGDSVFISNESKILLTGKDSESGTQYLSYSLNKEQKENKYVEPFSVTKSGLNEIDYFGYDNVNNRNENRFVFNVDNTPPEVYCNFSVAPNSEKDGMKIFPSYVQLFLASVDKQTGNAEIFYSVNGGKEAIYKSPLQGFEKNTDYNARVTAVDKLGNKSTIEIKFSTDKY